jgi:hypothetical protein
LLALLLAASLFLRTEQRLPVTYNQGVARAGHGWIVSGTNTPRPRTDVLARLDDDLRVVASHPAAIPARWRAQGYDHVGDVDVVGNVVYVPFEQPDYRKGHQVTARYRVGDLSFIDAVVLPQHENSFVAVDRHTMTAYSMDHFDGDALTRYDLRAHWRPLPPLPLSTTLHHTQGAAVAGGAVWISTSDDHNDVYRVDIATGHVDLVGTAGHPGGEGEGLDASDVSRGRLHVMVVDPAQTVVWFEHFRVAGLPPAHRSRPWLAVTVVAVAVAGLALLGVTVLIRRRRPT